MFKIYKNQYFLWPAVKPFCFIINRHAGAAIEDEKKLGKDIYTKLERITYPPHRSQRLCYSVGTILAGSDKAPFD